jgi:nucleoside-diphosphate-sugar epimerase
LGTYIVEQLLERGHHVKAMTRRKDYAPSGRQLELIHGDVRDAESMLRQIRDVDVVLHTAGVSGIWGPWKLFHSANTIGTRNVVEACLENGISRLVYTSSPSVTFEGQHQLNVNESAPYAKTWLCHYPHSKALAEQRVLEANDPSSLMTCVLRPHLIWGPRDNHLVPRLLQRAKAKQLRRVGDGTNQIDTIYVENAARAHIDAAEALQPDSPVCGSVYFLSQNEPVNCWSWINDILGLAGLPRVRQSISYYWAYRLGMALEASHEMLNIQREPRMTRFLAAQLAKSHYYDISRAQRDFGYRPKVSMEEGMRRLAVAVGGFA